MVGGVWSTFPCQDMVGQHIWESMVRQQMNLDMVRQQIHKSMVWQQLHLGVATNIHRMVRQLIHPCIRRHEIQLDMV